MNLKDFLRLGGLPIFIASLCCLTPIILVLFGISSIAFAASLTNILEGQYKFIFILAGAITLIVSLIIYFTIFISADIKKCFIFKLHSFIIFKNGKPAEQFVGVQRKEDLKKKIDALLK